MENNQGVITCIISPTMREIIKQAKELEIKKEDIVNIFPLNGQIYLVYFKK